MDALSAAEVKAMLPRIGRFRGTRADGGSGDLAATWRAKQGEPEPLAMISTYLRADKNLNPEAAAALDEVVKATYARLRTQEA